METLKPTWMAALSRGFSTATVITRAAVILVFSLPALTNRIVLRFWQRGAAAVALTELFSRRRIPIKVRLRAAQVCGDRAAARSGWEPAQVRHSGEPRSGGIGCSAGSEPGTRKRPVVLCNSQVMGEIRESPEAERRTVRSFLPTLPSHSLASPSLPP